MKNELLEFDMDCAILWGVNEYESKETPTTEDNNDEYLLIDNPINRIKDMKY